MLNIQGIGVTEEFKIGGEETALYNALTIATVEHNDEVSLCYILYTMFLYTAETDNGNLGMEQTFHSYLILQNALRVVAFQTGSSELGYNLVSGNVKLSKRIAAIFRFFSFIRV